MTWVSTMFHQGGPTMFMITGLIIPALALVGVHIGMRRKWSLFVSLGAIALILGIGLYGMMQGRGRTDAALGAVEDEQDRVMIREEGYKESSRPMQYAGVVGGILIVGVLVAQLRSRRQLS
jgi:hypothetical protein